MDEPQTDGPRSALYMKPYLRAVARLQERETLNPRQLCDRAERLLLDTFGPSDQVATTRYASGSVALPGEHTYYFDGFALMLMLPQGTAVALRPAPGGQGAVVLDGTGADPADPRVGLVEACLHPHESVRAAVVSTIPEACGDGAAAALAVATLQAGCAAHGVPLDETALVRRATGLVSDHLGRPYGVAPVLAARFGEPDRALAVDTATLEYVPLDLPARERLAWALVDVGPREEPDPSVFARRREAVSQAVERLQQGGLGPGGSLRSLEHRTPDAALRELPRRLRPYVRHLVTENRRVQQMIVALRRADSQFLGGLLLISQASLETDWEDADERVRFVFSQGRDRESVYGARMVGREFGSALLFAGQPLAVTRLIDDLPEAYRERFGEEPRIVLF